MVSKLICGQVNAMTTNHRLCLKEKSSSLVCSRCLWTSSHIPRNAEMIRPLRRVINGRTEGIMYIHLDRMHTIRTGVAFGCAIADYKHQWKEVKNCLLGPYHNDHGSWVKNARTICLCGKNWSHRDYLCLSPSHIWSLLSTRKCGGRGGDFVASEQGFFFWQKLKIIHTLRKQVTLFMAKQRCDTIFRISHIPDNKDYSFIVASEVDSLHSIVPCPLPVLHNKGRWWRGRRMGRGVQLLTTIGFIQLIGFD